MAHSPFHFAFPVRDLAGTRAFSGGRLGCAEGLDEVEVPIPHAGAILPWEEFQRLAERLRAAGTRFVIEPTVRYRGRPEGQATMFLLDPSGNALELEAYRDPSAVYHR